MLKYIRIYKMFVINSAMNLLAHRFDLVLSAVANIIWTLGQLLALSVISERSSNFAGWGLADLALLLALGQGFVYSAFIVYDANFRELPKKIIRGELDFMLTKPVSIKFLASFEKVSIAQIIPWLVSVLPLLAYGLRGVTDFNLTTYAEIFILQFMGILIAFFFSLALAGLSFFMENTDALREYVIGGIADTNRVPLNLFPRALELTLVFVIPVAWASYFPAQIARGEMDFAPLLLGALGILAVMYFISKIVWHYGLKRYAGAA